MTGHGINAFAVSLLITLSMFIAGSGIVYADNSGGRGVYLHGGWAGARYVASGMTGEVLADDVFSIYWNPAGLSELEIREKVTAKEITDSANSGKLDDITEDDLLNFSEDGSRESFFAVGASVSMLDVERNALFSGVAFSGMGGVFGVGFFTIVSGDIETRDGSGNLTGTTDYSGSAAYLSYAISGDIFSFGLTLKGLHEVIGKSSYAGAGADFGLQASLLPFLRAGFMIRDAGSFLRPYDAPGSEKRYDFIMPQIKGGILFISDSGFRFSFCGSKKLEQNTFGYGIGVEYVLGKNIRINSGIENDLFAAGVTFIFLGMELSYAFSFDRVDSGYNNTLSASLLL